jgi:tRNA dimethylallyltransferase
VAWLDRDRADLYKRIDQRVESMLSAGWQEEVRDLCTQIPADSAAMQSLGYRSLIHVIAGTHPLRDVILQIQQETRNFAKRQLTWFRNKTPSTRICLTESGEICEISAIEKLFQK